MFVGDEDGRYGKEVIREQDGKQQVVEEEEEGRPGSTTDLHAKKERCNRSESVSRSSSYSRCDEKGKGARVVVSKE